MRSEEAIKKKAGLGALVMTARTYYILCMSFLMIPVLIFCAGYLRLYIGIPVALVFVALLVFAVRGPGYKSSSLKEFIKLPWSYVIICIVLALLLSFVTGIGEFVYSLEDHVYRRAMLRDLINYEWPVIYDTSTQTNPVVAEFFADHASKSALTYYFTYFLPAALIGKIGGMTAGCIALLIWNSLGIFLIFLGMTVFAKRPSFAGPFILVFFAGLDAIPNAINAVCHYDWWLWMEGYVPYLCYVANFTELCDVFHQIIPCFIIVLLLMTQPDTRSEGLTASLLFAYSPWATIGILPLAIGAFFRKEGGAGKGITAVKNIFTPVNILAAGLMLFLFGSFYMSNSGSISFQGIAWTLYANPLLYIPAYLIFIAVEVLPFYLILRGRYGKDPMFAAACLTLVLLPVYVVSEMNDFTMRGSMPALFVIQLLLTSIVAEKAHKNEVPKETGARIKTALASLALILMMFPALLNMFVIFGNEIKGSPNNVEAIGSYGNIEDESYLGHITNNFMAEGYEDSFFYKYLARQ